MTETLTIKGLAWKISVQSEKEYDKCHGNDSHGITHNEDRHIYIRYNAVNIETILHELGHAYYTSCLTYTADLNIHDVEEIFCEILSVHTAEILKTARQLLNYMKNTISEDE